MRTVIEDFKYAFRALLRRPGLLGMVTLTLAVAVSGSVVIFSVIDTVLHLLPIEQPDRVVFLESSNPQRGPSRLRVSLPDFQDWRAQNITFEQLGAFRLDNLNLTGTDKPLRVSVVRASTGLFDVWGVRPALGRSFRSEEDRPGAEAVVMLSHRFWQHSFGGDEKWVGRTLLLNGVSHTVIGVLPPSISSGVFLSADVWVSLENNPGTLDRGLRNTYVSGLMKTGIKREQAGADIERISRRLQEEYPNTNANFGARLLSPVEAFNGDGVWQLIIALGSIAVLLIVIACANTASLILAWSVDRQREFLIRTALGSPGWRLVRQLMTEHLILSLFSGAVAVLLTAWGLAVVRQIAGETSPLFGEMVINSRVLAFTLLVSLATPLLFGLASWLRSLKGDLSEGLKEGSRNSPGRRAHRVQSGLVVCQIALALAVMVGVGLLARTMIMISRLEKGIDPTNVLTVRIDLPASRYVTSEQVFRFHDRLIDGISKIPAVRSVGIINRLPLADRELPETFTIEGQPIPAPGQLPWTARAVVSPGYRETMRIPLVRGRDLQPTDSADAPRVALISRVMANRYWPQEEPIGKRIRFGEPDSESPWIEIVGVVGDVQNSDVDAGLIPQVYLPFSQEPMRTIAVLIRTADNAEALTSAVRVEASEVDRDLPIYGVATMEQVLYREDANNFILLGILIALAIIALVLSASGVYGVMAYSVAERTREIGIRMALGAHAFTVFKMVLQQGLVLLFVGTGFGLLGGFAFGRLLSSVLFQISSTDPPTYIAVSALLWFATFLGCYVPAVRATRVDPMVALRHE